MQFTGQDIFVGGIAILLGVICLYGSLAQRRWFFRSHKVRWLESRMGRTAARWICVAIAAILILFGGAIAAGFNLQRALETDRANLGSRPAGYRLAGWQRLD